ncbi:hypothetical protein BO71DRAFT_343492 [Aspergillus ellipticus CBS 707.79]|uniref:Uncharacterized protein n=1 Tax=Aspergillus ellipticus CBS 707.79 TaxID=1448320 RepID=A0A319DXZ5_9EURO|nr:hypothetical protein BO71DRAFT_343492 [Aspergillus ellipticus CBS 707.79]
MELLNYGSEYTIDDCQMALRTVFSEREFEKSIGKTALLLDQERQRAHKMEQLLLQFENENLQSQLGQAKQELARTGRTESDVRTCLFEMTQDRDRLQTAVHVASHELENLRRELSSMGNATLESRNLVAENIRLSKELASVQSEIERLQGQESSSQTLIAENQSLVRQINSLEVEFENEKRAHRTTLSRGAQQADELSELTKKFEEQRKQLLAEARQAPVAQQQNQRWEAERVAFQDRIDTLNRKLQLAKDQLQEAHTNRQSNSRLGAAKSSGLVEQSKPNPIQRFTARINPELTIATPGAVRVKDWKKRSTALPGDKSAFSITPFLNRTSGQQDSPASSQDERDGAGDDDDAHETSYLDSKIQDADSQDEPEERRPKPAKQRSNKSTAAGRPKKGSRLKPVDDDDDSDETGPSTASIAQAQARTKRRKLGNQSKMVIEEEEEEEEEEEDDLQPKEVRKPGRKLALGLGRNTSLQAPGGSNRGFGGFGGFSPLKRDRK